MLLFLRVLSQKKGISRCSFEGKEDYLLRGGLFVEKGLSWETYASQDL